MSFYGFCKNVFRINASETLSASEDIFQNQIQILNTEITAKKFEQQKAEFRLKGKMWLIWYNS